MLYFRRAVAVAALIASAGCYTGGPLDPPSRDAPSLLSQRRLRRLSNREYDNVVRDLLGNATRPARTFIVDAYPNGYDNGSAGLAVQSDQVVAYQAAAETIAASVVADEPWRVLGGCDPNDRGEDACVDAFVTTFAARAYRRPLTPTEAQLLRDVHRAEAQLGGFARGLSAMIEVVLQSPQFLYREELGPPDARPSPGASVRLTDYEIASELSFLLTGSIPDDALWSAVAAGRFTTDADRAREAMRLLDTPGAREALRAFLHEWLGTDRVATLTKDSRFYPAFDAQTAASMAGELDRFYDDVLASDAPSLRRLFTSERAFVDETLAKLYGVDVTGPTFVSVALDPALRQGVMTRAGFLAAHADTDGSGPIARGVFVLDAILCAPPSPPPPNVPPAASARDDKSKTMTTRQRFARHVSSSFCASCHDRIDGVGFGFEQFDGVGAFRATENGLPVDTSGNVIGTGEMDGAYVGVSALSTKIAGSRALADCYVKQAYRYAMGQIEPAGAPLRSIDVAFTTDARLTDVLLAIVQNPIFVTRTYEREGR